MDDSCATAPRLSWHLARDVAWHLSGMLGLLWEEREPAAHPRESSAGNTWEAASSSSDPGESPSGSPASPDARVLRVPAKLPGAAADAVDGLPAGGVGGSARVLVPEEGARGVFAEPVERVALLQGHALTSPNMHSKINILEECGL